jgi:hypothetical protein
LALLTCPEDRRAGGYESLAETMIKAELALEETIIEGPHDIEKHSCAQ